MSWKSFVTAGLLCVVASPVFAQPTMTVVKGGSVANNHLDANGNWVWQAQVTPDYAMVPDASGTPIGAELGFSNSVTGPSNDAVISATVGSGMSTAASGAGANPGNVIFGWETLTNLGGTGDCSSGNPGNCPVGVQVGTGADDNDVFSAIGSNNLTSGAAQYLVLTVSRPVVSIVTPETTTTVTVSGAYGGGGDLGRIAQITGGTPPNYTTGNFDTFSGMFTRTARGGDADLDGDIDFDDFQSNLLLNYNQSGKSWQHGDFDGTGTVDFNDFQILLTQYNTTYSVGSGAGSGGGGAVPEPTAAVLALLAGCAFLGRRIRG
jgi:hypothetical protein